MFVYFAHFILGAAINSKLPWHQFQPGLAQQSPLPSPSPPIFLAIVGSLSYADITTRVQTLNRSSQDDFKEWDH